MLAHEVGLPGRKSETGCSASLAPITMGAIENIYFRKVLDSRGNATIEVDVLAEDGFGRAAAPSGASTGAHEVAAWAKGGVDESLKIAREGLTEELLGIDVLLQREVDEQLTEFDGTENFSKIGGNLAVATSLAVARCAAHTLEIPLYAYLGGAFVSRLPRPFGNVLGGGAHAVGGTDIQEYMAVALGPTVAESVFANARVHKLVKEKLKERFPGVSLGKGDEGAWNAPIGNVEAAEVVAEACRQTRDETGVDVRVALDDAAATGVCVVLVGPDGERTMLSDRGANAALAPQGLVEAATWVHVSGYADPREAVGRARAAGVPVSVDPGPHGAAVAADVQFPSRGEAAGDGEVFRTLGAGGAEWTDGVERLVCEARPVEVVDTTGAGDAFAAGVIAARLRGEPVEAQLAAGVALAARCVSGPGARPLRTG